MRLVAVLALCSLAWPALAPAQAARPAAQRRPATPATKKVPAEVKCPATLGRGVDSQRVFCDVLTATSPEDAVAVVVPPHQGAATLTFDLHNRHTYSAEEEASGRAYARYLATIAVVTPAGEVLARASIMSDVRSVDDLLDRVPADDAPAEFKAVAPTGQESIVVTVPADVTEVYLIGERLVVERLYGRDVFTAPGRPVAIVSGVGVEYRPAPVRRAPPRKR